MLSFADHQAAMMHAIRSGGTIAGVTDGRGPAPQRLAVYRQSVTGILCGVLRAHYPTVLALIGDDCFDGVATDFIWAHPPTAPVMADYGAGFAGFLTDHRAVQDLSYLPDVAHFDAAMVACGCAQPWDDADAGVACALTPDVVLHFASSLRVIAADYPVDDLRAVLDAGDEDALGTLGMAPRLRWFLMWRTPDATRVRLVSAAAAAFVQAAMTGSGAERAFSAALAHGDIADVQAALQTEIIPAPYVRLITGDNDD
jgi:hypothetical protein